MQDERVGEESDAVYNGALCVSTYIVLSLFVPSKTFCIGSSHEINLQFPWFMFSICTSNIPPPPSLQQTFPKIILWILVEATLLVVYSAPHHMRILLLDLLILFTKLSFYTQVQTLSEVYLFHHSLVMHPIYLHLTL